MSEYSDNLYEIEWAVFGKEIIGDLYKLTETGPVMIKSVQVGLPDGVRAPEFVATLDALVSGWHAFTQEAFENEGWTGNFVPAFVVEWEKIYILPYNRPTYRVPVQVSVDYIELITEVSV
jgi:hypothetical protein